MEYLLDFPGHEGEFFIDDKHSKIADIFFKVPFSGNLGNYEITYHANNYITIRRLASEIYFEMSNLSREIVEDEELYNFVFHQLAEWQKGKK